MTAIPQVPADITPRAFFEEFLVDHFAVVSGGEVKSVDATLQIAVGGEAWALTVKDGKLVVSPGGDPAALAQVLLEEPAWRALLDEANGLAARTDVDPASAFRFFFPQPMAVQMIKNAPPGTAEVRLTRPGADPLVLRVGFKEMKPAAPRTKITMALSDWLDVAAKKLVPAQLLMQGKAKVEGDMALAMSMSMLLA